MKQTQQLLKEGRKQEAIARLNRIVVRSPGDAKPAVLLARLLAEQGEAARAQSILLEQQIRHPRDASVHLALGELLGQLRRFDEADGHYLEACKLLPQDANVASRRALMLQLAGRLEEAAVAYEAALRREPSLAGAVHNLAAIRLAQGDLDAAEQGFLRVIERSPGHPNAMCNLAAIAERRGDDVLAEARYVAVLRTDANNPIALSGLGHLLVRTSSNPEWAESCLKAFLRHQPDSARAYNSLGVVLIRRGATDEALPCLEAAVEYAREPELEVAARQNLVNALLVLGRQREAVPQLENLCKLRPRDGNLLLNLARLKLGICDWSGLEDICARIEALRPEELPDAVSPIVALALPRLGDDVCFSIAARHAARVIALAEGAAVDRVADADAEGEGDGWQSVGAVTDERLRIGYLGTMVEGHDPLPLMKQLVESHDRASVVTFAYTFNDAEGASARSDAQTDERPRILAGLTTLQAAQRIRDDRLDALVDLNGWTSVQHVNLLACRPASVTLSLGYPASLGDRRLADAILADAVSIPERSTEKFAEKVLRLPVCPRILRPRDANVMDGEPVAQDSSELAIAFIALVPLHCLNPDVVDVWSGLLVSAPMSNLVLDVAPDHVQVALRQAFALRGIDGSRIRFVESRAESDRFEGLSAASVALDTWPLNAEAFVLDAISAGIPVVSLAGSRLAGRIGASLLAAAGVPQLATDSVAAYSRLALELATKPEKRAGVREKMRIGGQGANLSAPIALAAAIESACRDLAHGRRSDR